MVPAVTNIAQLIMSQKYVDSGTLPEQIAEQASAYLSFCPGVKNASKSYNLINDIGGYRRVARTSTLTINKDGTFIIGLPEHMDLPDENFYTLQVVGMYFLHAVRTLNIPGASVYPLEGDTEKEKHMLEVEGLRFALAFLMPEVIFRARVRLLGGSNTCTIDNKNFIQGLQHHFYAPQHVILQRLMYLGFVPLEFASRER
jgi:hypothetical protein